MQRLAAFLLCLFLVGCATRSSRAQEVSVAVAAVIKEERLVAPFEARLRALGAEIRQRGPGEKEAALPIETLFHYIMYKVGVAGEITIISAKIVAVAHS